MRRRLLLLPDRLAVCQLDASSTTPDWATCGSFYSITRTPDELSIVCAEAQVPGDVKPEGGWRAFKVEGTLDFALTGVLESIARPLADAKVSIFAVSTFNTDYVLVKEESVERAIQALGELFELDGYEH